MQNKKNIVNIVTVLCSVLIGLGVCELVLVLSDWSPQKTTSEYMQFGYSTGVPIWDEDGVLEEAHPVKVKLFQYDPELFWKTIPNTEFTNSQGFRGTTEVPVTNRNHAVRILILGDSCSFLGRKLYADFLHDRLNQDFPDTQFEIINASVPGYTSFQGKMLLKQLMQYKPQYACIYFGWNDHWIIPSGYSDQFHYDLIHSPKVVQLARIMLARVMDMREYRVPLDGYRANLTAMIKELEENRVVPVLIGAPSGYGGKGMPAWAYNFYRQYYRMTAGEIEKIPETHKAYAGVAADLAQDFKAIYVDAQANFDRLSPSLKPFFRNDLIHLTVTGHQTLADEIFDEITAYNASRNLSWDDLQAKSEN